MARQVATWNVKAKRVLKTQSDISEADLGRAVGASARTGQRLLARLSEAA